MVMYLKYAQNDLEFLCRTAMTRGKTVVLVVDGNNSALRALGFPLPALAAMQEAGVQLGQACWDVKQSTSGISVSFFWPQTDSRQTRLRVTRPALNVTTSGGETHDQKAAVYVNISSDIRFISEMFHK